MPRVTYDARAFDVLPQESVLDAFLRQGIDIPFSCRGGVCQVCLQRCTEGDIPPRAQQGLRAELAAERYFMPCVCLPGSDMRVEPPLDEHLYQTAVVSTKELLTPDIARLLLEPATPLNYRPGQFINLRGPNGLVRSYSLAGLPEDYFLEIHVKRLQNGAMSNWILDSLNVGDSIDIQGPDGDFSYRSGQSASPMLMICTGTGLAPALGVLLDALRQEHAGEIHLYHGSSHIGGLYAREVLDRLMAEHSNFHYHRCISGDALASDCLIGRAHEVAMAQHADLRGWHVYLAGMPQMVESAEAMAIAQGAAREQIRSDAFVLKNLRRENRTTAEAPKQEASPVAKPKDPPADPELWQALQEGRLLREILEDFYTRVYADPRLAPFFRNATKQRLVEKQYSFMNQIITGRKVYFGDRPRNAHHWMVISDELFDYRAALMLACMRDHGLNETMAARWHAVEDHYRDQMVKSAPWPKVVNGQTLPLDGFDELTIDSGTLCDGCGKAIQPGERVRYHLRLGTTYCEGCKTFTQASANAQPDTPVISDTN